MSREIEDEDNDEQETARKLTDPAIVLVLVRDISIFQIIDIGADRTRITRRQR